MTTLTAAGRGAIAVVAVWGERAVSVVDAAFRPARGPSLAATPPGRHRFGRIGRGLGDEVVAVILDESPPAVEVHCHGGPAALELVTEALEAAGAKAVAPAAWAEHQAGSPLRAAALLDLARAPTVRTASILLDQSQGALDRALDELVAIINDQPPSAALDRIEDLLARGRVGVRLTTGWRVVLRGRPNVGKSRLLNALAGYQRAIVDPTPGTTRDAVTVATAFDGWPVQLVDTAGVRETDDELERSGIERTARHAGAADLLLQVLDRSAPLEDQDRRPLDETAGPAMLLVANKADLPAAWDLADLPPAGGPAVVVSAERGDGLDDLMAAVVARLVPDPPHAGAGVPFRDGHLAFLQAAAGALREGDRSRAVAAIVEGVRVPPG